MEINFTYQNYFEKLFDNTDSRLSFIHTIPIQSNNCPFCLYCDKLLVEIEDGTSSPGIWDRCARTEACRLIECCGN